MVFLTNSSDDLILFLIMMYISFLVEEDKVQRYGNIYIILYICVKNKLLFFLFFFLDNIDNELKLCNYPFNKR